MNRPSSLKSCAALVVALLVLASAPAARADAAAAGEPALVVIVRHAEKATAPKDDPPLSAAGAERARALANALAHAGVTAVVTTQLKRTQETAQPIVDALELTPEVVAVGDEPVATHAANVAAAVRRHSKGVVLVVGHSNTVPDIIAALGGPRIPEICESQYANLFVLAPGPAQARLVRGAYGAADGPPSGCE
jgi:broad specificity phosphatase PhoE